MLSSKMRFPTIVLVFLSLPSALSCKPSAEQPAATNSTSLAGQELPPETQPVQAAPGAGGEVAEFLPIGEFDVSVKGYHVSPETEALMARWQAALRQQPDWWAEFLSQQAPGEPLPYHPNFGITEDEYVQMMRGMEQMEVREVARSRLSILDRGNGVIGFQGGEPISALNAIEIDARADVVRTPFGRLQGSERISRGANSPLGPFDGRFWNRPEADEVPDDPATVKFGIGRNVEGNSVFIDYRAKKVTADGQLRRADVLVSFEVP
jgi:hypothetical protein